MAGVIREDAGGVGGAAGGSTTIRTTTIRSPVSSGASSVGGWLISWTGMTMNREEIYEKIKALIKENNESGTPMSTMGGLAMLKQYKRMLNDTFVLMREILDQCK